MAQGDSSRSGTNNEVSNNIVSGIIDGVRPSILEQNPHIKGIIEKTIDVATNVEPLMYSELVINTVELVNIFCGRGVVEIEEVEGVLGMSDSRQQLRRLFSAIGFLDFHLPLFYQEHGSLDGLFQLGNDAHEDGYLEGAIIAVCEEAVALSDVFDNKLRAFAGMNNLDIDEVRVQIRNGIVQSLDEIISRLSKKVEPAEGRLRENMDIFRDAVTVIDNAMSGDIPDVNVDSAFKSISNISDDVSSDIEYLKYSKPRLETARNLRKSVQKAVQIEL